MSDHEVRDRGYGWVIVAAFFFVEVIVDGIRFSWGLFYIEFLSTFNSSKTEAALVGALMVGSYNLCGPIFALIITKFGYRISSIVGSLITTLGFITSFYTTNLYQLYFTYGFMQGFGYGLVFLSGTVAVGQYFHKKRALAIGIAFCGSGVGTFIFPPLVRILIQTYAWRGSVLLLAGFTLQLCVLCAFLRPFDSSRTQLHKETHQNESECSKTAETDASNGLLKHELQSTPLVQPNIIPVREIEIGQIVTDPSLPISLAEVKTDQIMTVREDHMCGSHHSLNMSVISQSILGSNASFEHIMEKRNKIKLFNLRKDEMSSGDASKRKFRNTVIENMFPKVLVTDVNFIILMTSTIFIGIPSFVPMSMLPDYAISIGASEPAVAWLLSTIGICGTVSRVVSGWLADIPCVHRLTLHGVCLLVIGVTTVLAALVPEYEVLITYSSFFGIFYGAIYVVQPVVLLEYFGEHYISEVMGVLMCVYGVSNLIGTPLAGFIFDLTGSYRTSFLFAGASFLMSGIINFLVLCTKTGRNVRQRSTLELNIDVK